MIRNKNFSKRIAITGGIGTGKSTVCARLRQLGATVISADAASREVVEKGQDGLRLLTERFGEDILHSDGSLDRKKLAAIVFESDDARSSLNAILHPLMLERMLDKERAFRRKYNDAPLFYEIPLLYETNMQSDFDEVWLVMADDAVRMERIIARDRLTPQEAKARMDSQMPQAQKAALADRLIDNSGETGLLLAKVDALYGELILFLNENVPK